MPTRRTSPRRTVIRPSGPHERPAVPDPDDAFDDPGFLAGAAPWFAVLAVVLAVGTLGYVLFGRSGGGDLTACRTAAWSAIPKAEDLPDTWSLTSTDLNANGMTISIVGPTPADGGTNQPVVYASVTCYGAAAVAALEANRTAAEAAGSTVSTRTAGGAAYDVDNTSTGGRTTLFRVGGLIGQVADGGTASPADLAAITAAVASAMGDRNAAGSASAPSDDPNASPDPLGSGDVGAEPSSSPFAPDLEALLPRSVDIAATSGASPAPVSLSVVSANAAEAFGDDPSSRALAARIRAIGGTFEQRQIAQAFDESGTIDLLVNAFRLPGGDVAKLKAAIVETWLS
ncbi:MAG: hypothetical protein ABIZ72_08430, partial [Candidatus Limnocylindrales bacterium]